MGTKSLQSLVKIKYSRISVCKIPGKIVRKRSRLVSQQVIKALIVVNSLFCHHIIKFLDQSIQPCFISSKRAETTICRTNTSCSLFNGAYATVYAFHIIIKRSTNNMIFKRFTLDFLCAWFIRQYIGHSFFIYLYCLFQ